MPTKPPTWVSDPNDRDRHIGEVGVARPKHKPGATTPRTPKVVVPPKNSYLTFQSWSWKQVHGKPREYNFFSAMCGENPPTIVDGYGKWNVIDRPLRQGVTVPTGFNPARVKIEVRFGIWDGRYNFPGWDTGSVAADNVERDIDNLHWMAGGNFEAGPSPIVYVDSYSATNPKNRTKLFPRQYRGVAWVIDGGVEWGNSLRHPNGDRVYQEATFTVLGYTSLGNPPPARQNKTAGGFFVTNKAIHTALAIASNNKTRAPEAVLKGLARAILRDKRNNPCRSSRVHLARKGITDNLPLHLHVWVPSVPV